MLANVNSRVEILETQLSSFIEGFKEMLESDGVGVDNLFKNPSAPTASSKKPAKEKIVGRHQSCACASVKRELDALKKKKTIGERDATVSASVKEYVRKEIKRSEKDLLEEVISPLIAQELVDFEYRLKGLAHGQDRDSGFISLQTGMNLGNEP
ncbi:hypothetical protein BC829DRAFT_199271 [Chytridium lagenaria]|nr:hypothetical protein BC829DRAFT_199271 [Chytridium lagenaria]